MTPKRRILVWGLPLVGMVLMIMFLPLPMPTPQDRYITMDATQFQFSPGRLEVNYGDHVALTLTASDVTYGFYLDGYGLQQQITPGIASPLLSPRTRPAHSAFAVR